ncbi:MAG: M24 family metallopeptidase [Candidatus Hodarchaeales archaeon]
MSKSYLPLQLKAKILREKHDQLPQIMRKYDIDCWLIFARETSTTPDSAMNFVVGSDVVAQSAFIFFLRKNQMRKIAIVGNFDAETERNKGLWDEVIPYDLGIEPILEAKIQELTPTKIALNYSTEDYSSDGLTHGMFLVLEDYLSEFSNRFVSAQPIVNVIRSNKSETEIELIREACHLTEEINEKMTATLNVGQSETDIQKRFHEEVQQKGFGFSWQREGNPAIDAGKDKEYGHVLPQETNYTAKGQTLHNDFGIKYHGYCSDLQRMWFFGKKNDLPDELRHAMDTVLEAIQRAAKGIRPGLQGYKIDKIAREYIISQGYEEYKHGLGHQVGIMAHDGAGLFGPLWPRYGDGPKQVIEVGQVYTIEPNVKTKNHGMVSMEEMVVVTTAGCEFLVEPKRDFIYISK